MRKAIDIVVVVCFVALTLKGTLPNILGSPWIQIPALVTFGALVAVAFALAIWDFYSMGPCRGIPQAIGCLVLFAAVNCLVMTGGLLSRAAPHALDTVEALQPPELFEGLVNGSTEDKRQDVARHIYRKFGTPAPYKRSEGDYELYKPSAEDKKAWQQTRRAKRDKRQMERHLEGAYIQSLWVGGYLNAAFVIFFAVTMLRKYKLSKRHGVNVTASG